VGALRLEHRAVWDRYTRAVSTEYPAEGIWAAVKADTLSLTAWQIGMYGFMAFAYFYLFRDLLGTSLQVNTVEFWFMMQIAMICGFMTAYPINWWLIRTGVKEKM